MRALVFLALIVLLLAIAGWVTFSRGPGRASVNFETSAIREDTQEALDTGSRVLENAGDAVDRDESVEPEPSTR